MSKLYTTREAADYLGLTVATIKYHVHKSGYLVGQLYGHTRLFTQEELDDFEKNKPSSGWPKGKSRD